MLFRSGSNQFHGSAFEYHTNNRLKARPFFFPADQDKPKLVDNQFGGTVGGPILHDKLFFFASYEASYNHQFAGSFGTVPTAAMRTGNLAGSPAPVYDPATGSPDGSGRTAFGGNVIPAARISPIVQKLIDLTPLPNQPGLSNNYFASAPSFFRRTTVDGKINWNATSKMTLFGRFGAFLYDMRNRPLFDELGGPPTFAAQGAIFGNGNTYNTAVGGTYALSPTLIVDANFGWARKKSNAVEPRLDENLGRDFLGIPGTNGRREFEGGWPQFQITNFTSLGINSNKPFFHDEPSYTYVANTSWIKGAHQVRFGTDISRLEMNHLQAEYSGIPFPGSGGFIFTGGPTTIRGGASPNQYNSFGAYLLGLPQSLGKIQVNSDVLTARAWLLSFYAQDQWQLSRKLTVSYGVRYEYFPMPTRAERGFERYDPATNLLNVCGVGAIPTDCGVDVSKKLFAPRLGLAYRATPSFVIRAGYGITYDPYNFARNLRDGYPTTSILQLEGANSFQPARTLVEGIPVIPAPDLGNGVLPMPGNLAQTTIPLKIRRGYTQSFNFTLEKEVGFGLVAQAGYVGSRQLHILGPLEINPGQVGGGSASRPLNVLYGRTAPTGLLTDIPGIGHYDSLQTSLKRSFAKGVQFQGTYTWSKATGIATTDNANSSDYGRKPQIVLPGYYQLNQGLAAFDRTHVFSFSGVAELPFGKGKPWQNNNGLIALLAGGWQVNGILSAYSGLPFSVLASGTSLDAPGNTQRADQVKATVEKLGGAGPGQAFLDPLAFAPVTQARFGTAGFNSVRGPGSVNLDLGLFRQFKVNERVAVQFRAEAFNATNTPHFANPGNNVSNLQRNPDGSIRSLGGFMEITRVTGIAREGIDERQFRLGLRISF